MNDSIQVSMLNPPAKLTKWSKEPTIADLKSDLEAAKSSQSTHVSNLNTWMDNLNATGSAKVNSPDGRSKIVPKLIRKQAEWRYAALSEPFLAADTLFAVNPVSWEDKSAAEQSALVLNNQFETKLNKVALIDEYIRTAVDEGTVVLRTGWVFEEETKKEEVPQYKPVVDPSVTQEYQQALQMQKENPAAFEQLPDEVKLGIQVSQSSGQPIRLLVIGSNMEDVTKVVKNHPTVEVCDSRNVYIDPTCMGDIDKAGFVIYSFETSMSELKRSGKYQNLENVNVENSSPLAEPDHRIGAADTKSFEFKDKARKKIVAYEYWGFRDIDGSGITKPIVATWIGDTLIRLEDNPYPDGKVPFVLVQYLPVRKSIYGEPDGALLEDNQRIQGAITRGMIDLMGRSANSQTGIAKGMLDATNRRKYEKGLDYEYNPGTDPRVSIHTHLYPEIPQSASFMLQMLNNEAESMTGVKAFASTGLTGAALGGSSTPASSVRSVLDAASKREMNILRRLANGIIQVGRKIISMNAVFLEDKEVVRVTNDEFVPIKRDDLQGNFDLKLSISTPEADEAKAQELAYMLQTMGNNMDPAMTKIILSDIARLRKMPDLAHSIKTFQPQPDPMAEEMRAAQLDHQKAQTELLRAQAQEAMAKTHLQSAKVPVEQAKAGNLQSQADKHNLEFMQSMGGTKHQQDMEKSQMQVQNDLVSKGIDQSHDMEMAKMNHNSSIMQKAADAEYNPTALPNMG